MLGPNHVFLSFKTEDIEIAKKFRDALVQTGYTVWFQEDLQCGHEWHGDIDTAIQGAGAIVVIWTSKSIKSPWVRHEASQAIARGNYAPVRVERLALESPYDRSQASDVFDFGEDMKQQPGFKDLHRRLKELMPTFSDRLKLFFWQQKAVILLFIIAVVALYMLVSQGKQFDEQISTQKAIFNNVKTQSDYLKAQGKILKSQLEKQDTLIQSGKSQDIVLNEQLNKQERLLLNTQLQSTILDNQTQQQKNILADIQKTFQPIQNFEVTARFRFESDNDTYLYFPYLQNLFADTVKHTISKSFPKGIFLEDGDSTTVGWINISNDAEFWSTQKSEEIFYLTSCSYISLGFNSEKNKLTGPDLMMTLNTVVSAGTDFKERPKYSLSLNLTTNEIFLFVTKVIPTWEWKSNGFIASIPDLENSILSIQAPYMKFDEFKSATLYLKNIEFKYSGRSAWFDTEKMKEEQNNDKDKILTCAFKTGVWKN